MNATALKPELEGRRILLVGASGQVGVTLQQVIPQGVELLALDCKALDITDRKAVADTVGRFRPDWVINAAAYTAVDKAESEPEAAFTINRDGAAHLAQAAAKVNARMVQISTDYVFDGKQARPYRPDDPVNPINVYGESKLAGEIAVHDALGDQALILRTAWVYAGHGKNFLTTMLRLMRERNELKVVEDQIGTPTSTHSLADALLTAVVRNVSGTHHWTDAGVASWYDFACAIHDEASGLGLIEREVAIHPVTTAAYPTPAKRPFNSVMDKSATCAVLGGEPMHWRRQLRDVLKESGGHESLSDRRQLLPCSTNHQ